jgi:phosphoglucosamine mutase
MKLFGTSGIRGFYGTEVNEGLALNVGRAMGTLLDGPITVGMDSRFSGEGLRYALISGIISQGNDVYDVGLAPTPTVGIALQTFGCCAGAVITASHNPPEYNGVKVWDGNGVAYHSLEGEIERVIHEGSFGTSAWDGQGRILTESAPEIHMSRIEDVVSFDSSFRVALDCGCGAGSVVSPYLLERLGMNVVSLNCQPSGCFPRGLEPSSENLSTLSHAVRAYECDIGIAHDGDADRVGAVDEHGEFIDYDVLLALIARYECEQSGSSRPVIVSTVDSSFSLDSYLSDVNASVHRTKVGDVALAQEIVKRKAVFGGEPSGTWIFPSQWLTPDGILAGVKLLAMKDDGYVLAEERKNVPSYVTLRKKLPMERIDRERFRSLLLEALSTEEYESMLTIDGIRVEYEDSWALYRFSGTEPLFRITVEAQTSREATELMERATNNVEGVLRKL